MAVFMILAALHFLSLFINITSKSIVIVVELMINITILPYCPEDIFSRWYDLLSVRFKISNEVFRVG